MASDLIYRVRAMIDHSARRLILIAGAALLGLSVLAALMPRAARKAKLTASRLTPHASRPSRIPLVSRILAAQPRTHAAAPATGGWTLDECLADHRRPDAASEVAALTAAAIPAELAVPLALEATDRAYHDALAQAAELAPAEGLAVLDAALEAAPEEHLIARLRLLDAMMPLARACRGLAERRALAARRTAARGALVELAARAGVLGAGEGETRRELSIATGTEEALEPLLAGLLASKSDGGAD